MRKIKNNESLTNLNRRDFLKLSATGTFVGATVLGGAGVLNADDTLTKKLEDHIISEHENFPNEIRSDYKPFPQVKNVFNQAWFGFHKELGETAKNKSIDKHQDKLGLRQVDEALASGATVISRTSGLLSQAGVPDQGYFSWKNKTEKDSPLDVDVLSSKQYKFQSKKEASDYIKRAAKLYGADLVGITKRDPKWDYSEHYMPSLIPGEEERTITWDEFPFEPKSVIVMAFEMDYEGISAAPSQVATAAAGEGYSKMTKTAYQLAVFLRRLGYQTIASGNDLGLNVPYAMAAGLGEGSRMGVLVTFNYGPRVRIAKVYTEFDFVEYDKPKTFGVFEFCKRCARCADACPSKAISLDEEPSFEPPNDGERWFNNSGTEKWFMDGKKCFEYWCESNTDCSTCITSCPYNKPDFWHHRLVDSISAMLPGPVHSVMREMDIIFGYGNTFDEDAIKKFWQYKE